MKTVEFGVNSTTREPSPIIWDDCPVLDLLERPGAGTYFFDNFTDLPLAPTLTTQIAYGKYKAYATTSDTIKNVGVINSVNAPGGNLEFAANADNDAMTVAQAYPSFLMTGSSADAGKLWFEARIALSSIAVNTSGFFLGLAETNLFTLSATVPFNAAYASTSNAGSMFGFTKDEAVGTGAINTAKADRATSFTNIGAGEGAFSSTAYTYTKLGFVYDPLRNLDCVRFYQDGVLLSTKVTRTVLKAYTNINANCLGLMFANIIAASGSAQKNYLQWWRCAQLNAGETWG